eukprot:CAMPEP_0184022220 /NCGR_PEP_ID=MMETSP0954-20121128/10471_1 /TAXON_ID=627963 /ORGANISM="Aplanochytrium sp, Strain PBS07" /LENGTH=280 /DNA_ID=CAMNT_0026304543 /DNA_START=52 /DNA_END=890 /DNA_ORIENTATION=+
MSLAIDDYKDPKLLALYNSIPPSSKCICVSRVKCKDEGEGKCLYFLSISGKEPERKISPKIQEFCAKNNDFYFLDSASGESVTKDDIACIRENLKKKTPSMKEQADFSVTMFTRGKGAVKNRDTLPEQEQKDVLKEYIVKYWFDPKLETLLQNNRETVKEAYGTVRKEIMEKVNRWKNTFKDTPFAKDKFPDEMPPLGNLIKIIQNKGNENDKAYFLFGLYLFILSYGIDWHAVLNDAAQCAEDNLIRNFDKVNKKGEVEEICIFTVTVREKEPPKPSSR